METLVAVLIMSVPFLLLIALFFGLKRWAAKHDPMGGRFNDVWVRTTGTTRRQHRDDQ